MATHRHTPACLLTTARDIVSSAAHRLDGILAALKDGVSGDVYDNVCRVIAVVELASDSLEQLADSEQAAHPELQCGEGEGTETPTEGAN